MTQQSKTFDKQTYGYPPIDLTPETHRARLSSKEFRFLTLDDVTAKGKTVFVRVDINCPLDSSSKKILDDTRIKMTRETLERLRDAKVVVGAHQGRPGDEDFTSLEAHAEILQKYVPQPVRFVEDVIGPEARNQIKNLAAGNVLVLDNLRLCSEENLAGTPESLSKTILVHRLASLLDIYVNDAFATAHRAQASIVGLPAVVQAVAGELMAKELEALEKAYYLPQRPSVYIIGGAKIEDKLPILENILTHKKADRILVGGIVANILLRAQGVDFGKAENAKLDATAPLIEKARAILSRYARQIVLPRDLGVLRDGKRVDVTIRQGTRGDPVRDIGKETSKEYADLISRSKNAVSSGPLGIFEEKEFDLGSRTALNAMAQQGGFTVVGGGHMGSFANMLGLGHRISHISTAGGAMLAFLAGEELPGVTALVKAAARYPPK